VVGPIVGTGTVAAGGFADDLKVVVGLVGRIGGPVAVQGDIEVAERHAAGQRAAEVGGPRANVLTVRTRGADHRLEGGVVGR